jgi:tetratricopeptide (TPR) repeat protein
MLVLGLFVIFGNNFLGPGVSATTDHNQAQMSSPWNSKQPLSELSHMASVYRKLGQFAAAENLYRVIIDELEKVGLVHDERLALALYSLAEVCSDQQRNGEALPLYKRAVEIWEHTHPIESLSVLWYSEALIKMQQLVDRQLREKQPNTDVA